ncbi:MBL fold metallo-hydrolase [Leisingera sp. ANG59]|uniref:MBL fold metallo-hydrolase n=1 Tax=Leisingera sp. ANG59 TaxID=2675221 RepID=UPI001572E106|nr:MBL fold metallo-hydrolase [Leisingera sp. ANG59]NSY39322.1 MBL fold metallo-hydrolase [Leisingera sp. ANG59]
MKITQIRNATQHLSYGGTRFLIDPMLSAKGAFPGFPGTINDDLANPLTDLPLPLDQIVDVDAVFVTHLHEDHWDSAAVDALPKDLPIIVPTDLVAEGIRGAGFTDVRVVGDGLEFNGISLVATDAVHGVEAVTQAFPPEFLHVGGAVFSHPKEKTLYLVADSVWYDKISEAIAAHSPEVIIVNCGNAQAFGMGRLIFNASDVHEVHKAAPEATLVGTHMEAVNHCVLTRSGMGTYAEQHGFGDKMLLPADGETVAL